MAAIEEANAPVWRLFTNENGDGAGGLPIAFDVSPRMAPSNNETAPLPPDIGRAGAWGVRHVQDRATERLVDIPSRVRPRPERSAAIVFTTAIHMGPAFHLWMAPPPRLPFLLSFIFSPVLRRNGTGKEVAKEEHRKDACSPSSFSSCRVSDIGMP